MVRIDTALQTGITDRISYSPPSDYPKSAFALEPRIVQLALLTELTALSPGLLHSEQ